MTDDSTTVIEKADTTSDQPLSHTEQKVPNGASAAQDEEYTSLVLPPCKLPSRQELEPVEIFVSKAIKEHQEDPDSTSNAILSEKYKALIEGFRNRKNFTLLTNVFLSIRTTGSSLSWLASDVIKHARLIRLLIRFDPFRADDKKVVHFDLVDAQFHFFLALGTANSVYCSQILSAMWELLMSTPHLRKKEEEDESIRNTRNKRIQRCHAGLATMLDLCPSSRTSFFDVIKNEAPFFPNAPAHLLDFYATQTLSVLRYLPRCKLQVVSFLIQKALGIDVQIKIDDNGDVMLDKEEKGDKDDDDEDKEDGGEIEQNEAPKAVNKLAEKLDSLMLILFTFFKQFDPSETFQLLAPIFDDYIVNTKKSKFVQFLLLPATKDSHRDFLGYLIELLLDVDRAMVTRHAAACYVASYVSRCKYVTAETAAESVDALMRWAEEYIKISTRIEGESHSLFYTVCQAAFYIMAFRGASLLSFEEYNLGKERWQSVCSHSLQPLNYCLESVKAEFLSLTAAHDLVEKTCREKITPTKKRWKKASTIVSPAKVERARGGVGGLGKGENPLDSFFPFDPYLLRRSCPHIDHCYRHWNGGGDNMDDDLEFDTDIPQSIDFEAMEDDLDAEDSDMDNDVADEARAATRKRLLSIASNATSVSSVPLDGHCGQEVRPRPTKRARALSVENGSW